MNATKLARWSKKKKHPIYSYISLGVVSVSGITAHVASVVKSHPWIQNMIGAVIIQCIIKYR